MSTPIPFDIEGHNIRFGVTDDDIPYAVAADFAKAMGYMQASDATRLLDEDEKGQQIVLTPGGPQEMNVIYEDGMWELIFRSTLDGAKAIKKRVKAVLKEIRETGRFGAAPPPLSIASGTVTWDHAAAVARLHYNVQVDAHGFRELLTTGGILTTKNGAPHRKWEHLFWPSPAGTRWEIHAHVLPQLIGFAQEVRTQLARAERHLQMSLPMPIAGLIRDELEGGAA